MTAAVTITIPGKPIGKGRPRFFGGHAVTPAATRSWEAHAAAEARLAMRGRAMLEGPLKATLMAIMPIPASWSKAKRDAAAAGHLTPHTGRPDLDNIIKGLDALNGIVFADDAQIAQLSAMKTYGIDPRVVIQITEMAAPAGAALERAARRAA